MAQGQAAPRLHEPGVALRQGEGDAGGHEGAPTAGGQLGVLARQQVEARVAGPCVRRQGQVGIEAHHGDDETGRHHAEVRRPSHPRR